MLDSKEIAKKALMRAEIMKSRKKTRIRRLLQTTAMLLCACAITATATYFTTVAEQPYTVIDDERPPLSETPFFDDKDTFSFMVPGFAAINFPANDENVEILLANPGENQYDLAFKIVLEETAETLFESDPVPPSAGVGRVTLAKALQEGEYKALLIITAYELGSSETVCTVTAAASIVVSGN